MTFNTFVREKNCHVYEMYRKDKARIAKVHSEVD